MIAADRSQRPPGRLSRRINASRHELEQLQTETGIQCREHRVGTAHTLLRFDENLLLTVALYATPGHEAPLIHLRRRADYGLFDQLAKHFEDIWASAGPIESAEKAVEHQDKPATSAADQLLDGLDYVWRPDQ